MARKSFQKGTVVERKYEYGTTYIARWREKDPEGRWKEKSKTLRDCPDKKTAQKELDRILREINRRNGAAAYQANVRFNDVLGKHWPNYLKSADVKPSTQQAWKSSIKKWVEPFFGKMLLCDIGPAEVGDFMAHLATNDLSPKYRKNLYNLIYLIFDLALENQLIEATPVRAKLHRPKVPRKEKRLLSVDQVKAFLRALKLPWSTPILVLAMTGVRAGELLALRWQNVDFIARRITVTHSLWQRQLMSPKTEASLGAIGMSEELSRLLVRHRETSKWAGPEDFVFCREDGAPLDPDSLRRSGIYPALKRAGIPYEKHASGCHMFRHLAGSIIHKETGSLKLAQKQLRHSNISTTGDIYTHVDEGQLDEIASILGENFGGSVVEMWYADPSDSQKVH